jgi:hypothetical protein
LGLRAGRQDHPRDSRRQLGTGYYSELFEEPNGIRIEANFVPGKCHLANAGTA